MIQILLLPAGFVLLIYGAGLLVDNASSLAKTFNIPNIVIGLTIVAFGTSAPELVVNVFSAVQNSPGIALGNVAGSNLFNLMLILGICAIIFPMVVKSNTTWTEIPLALLSAIVLILMANDVLIDKAAVSVISRIDGLLLLLFFAVFLAYNIHQAVKGDTTGNLEVKTRKPAIAVLLIFTGLIMLVAGGRLIVTAAVEIANNLGVSQRIIALTIISAGTSLPELATSAVAALKKNADIAIGNIVGSNIFNVFFVLGTTALIRPVELEAGANTDLLLNVFASLLLFLFVFTGKGRKISRVEGAIFVVLYAGYLVFLLA